MLGFAHYRIHHLRNFTEGFEELCSVTVPLLRNLTGVIIMFNEGNEKPLLMTYTEYDGKSTMEDAQVIGEGSEPRTEHPRSRPQASPCFMVEFLATPLAFTDSVLCSLKQNQYILPSTAFYVDSGVKKLGGLSLDILESIPEFTISVHVSELALRVARFSVLDFFKLVCGS